MLKRHYFSLLCIIFLLAGCATTPTPNPYYTHDEQIRHEVGLALARAEGTLTANNITVAVYDRVVTLNGFVEDQSQVSLATAVAKRVHGVRAVNNELVTTAGDE